MCWSKLRNHEVEHLKTKIDFKLKEILNVCLFYSKNLKINLLLMCYYTF